MKFDFTPDPKVLIALTHTTMQPLDALCELIDNAIDSFHSAVVQGLTISSPAVFITLPKPKELKTGSGLVRVQDNGPGLTAEMAENSIRAGFSGNNPYDTLGLFGMGFNISTGKLGNKTIFMTSRADMTFYIKTEIDLTKINAAKDYSLDAEQIEKGIHEPFSDENPHGTIIEISDWWPEGNANAGFIKKLVQYGMPKIREEIGRRYATILRKGEIQIFVNNEKCEAYEHCVWDESRYVVRKNGNIPAVMHLNKIIGSSKRCGKCTAALKSEETICPYCGSPIVRTIDEKVEGWIGIQRFDSDTDFGIDLIRNGRAIKIGEKNAFFEYVDELKHTTKDYPIDSQYGRIIGEIHLDFVPVDFLKQDFQRSSEEWQKAMSYIRGDSSLQPNKPNASENHSPMFELYQAYRRVRRFGRDDMYMGYWDPDSRSAKRISRDTEKEYYEKFKQKLPGYYDDEEWWKLVETASQPPVEEFIECQYCGAQNLKEAEICLVCGEVLKGKTCLNEECGMTIPLSASACPYCGASQIPIVMEPWTCEVCGQKNIANDNYCKQCGSKRGTKNPLSIDELIKHSYKVDELSSDGLIIPLSDGGKSNPVKVEVRSSKMKLINPMTDHSLPLVIKKSIGNLIMVIDFSHPYFVKCGFSPEQLVAGEVALYIYQERMDLSNSIEHNLSNIMWGILQANWKDNIEINQENAIKDTEDLLSEILTRLYDSLTKDASQYYDYLSHDQIIEMANLLLQQEMNLDTIGELKESGEYLKYVPYSFIETLYQEDPDMFFDGKVWKDALAGGGEDLLGSEIVEAARKKIIEQYGNCLHNLIIFYEYKYADIITLKRVEFSIEFLRGGMFS